eukprot:scaffold28278_cov26-Tisochrysis_lutea.AAC.9
MQQESARDAGQVGSGERAVRPRTNGDRDLVVEAARAAAARVRDHSRPERERILNRYVAMLVSRVDEEGRPLMHRATVKPVTREQA